MHLSALNFYRCPATGSKLTLAPGAEIENEEVSNGTLLSQGERKYTIVDGVPDLVPAEQLVGDAVFARNYYTEIADTYDENLHVTFDLYNDTEINVRTTLVNLLHLKSESKVLEVSAGTGKDSEVIASKLGKDGFLCLLDITPEMLRQAKQRLTQAFCPLDFVVGTACSLPFKDNYFDALYCFAGIGHFPDIKAGLREMARVVKPGGRVVFCEKNVPPWLRETQYGKILINNNPMFADELPLRHIPAAARDVVVRWINGEVHYVVDYTVGNGEPVGNFDLELPGWRGGTFNTRYFGKLEGVTPKTKALALKAREKLGISMHKWLDELLRREAEKILETE